MSALDMRYYKGLEVFFLVNCESTAGQRQNIKRWDGRME